MLHTQTALIREQYATGSVRERIEEALRAAGKDPASLDAGDLAPMEDFHTLGRLATAPLIELAGVTAADRVLDAGGGIGGTARCLAHQIGCQVVMADLTPEYCAAATGLAGRIEVREADLLALPFEDAAFDVVVTQHVQMNIADKRALYAELRRVLRPGGRLALWDITAGPVQPVVFPVPWADHAEHSHLVTPEALAELLTGAGFEASAWNDLTELSAEFLRPFAGAPPGPLGLHVFVPDFPAKVRGLLENLEQDRTRLIQAVLIAR